MKHVCTVQAIQNVTEALTEIPNHIEVRDGTGGLDYATIYDFVIDSNINSYYKFMMDGINIPTKQRYNFVVGFFVEYFNPPGMEMEIEMKKEYHDKIMNNIIRICTEIPNDNLGSRSRILSLETEKDENRNDIFFRVLNDKEIKKRIENKIGGTNKNKKNKKECKTLVESNIIEVLADAKSRGDARFTATIIEYYCEHKQKSKWFTYNRREYLLLGCKIYANQITLYSLYACLSSFLGSYKNEFYRCLLTNNCPTNINNIYLEFIINSFSNLDAHY